MPRYDLNVPSSASMTSPGDSSTPASRPPSITVCAPAPIALAMSPDSWMPPSAQIGMPLFAAAFAHW